MEDFFADIDSQIERLGGGWAAYLVRALWQRPGGLSRQQVIDAVLEDALDRGKQIPLSFVGTIQSTFQQYNSASSVFRREDKDDIFEFVGGKGSGMWRLRRSPALAWMAANGRACDFDLVRDR
jgi:hypothetical protein